jgi:hypothetical protein
LLLLLQLLAPQESHAPQPQLFEDYYEQEQQQQQEMMERNVLLVPWFLIE